MIRAVAERVETTGPGGEAGRCFDLGGTTFGLQSSDPEFCRVAATRYGSFEVRADSVFSLRYQVTGEAVPGAAEELARTDPTPQLTSRGEEMTIEGPGFRGRVDFRQRWAEFQGPCSSYPIDLSLRHLLARLRPLSLVVHGATLIAGRRAWWATGPSGCGKSTLAGLFPEFSHSDELSMVRIEGDSARLHSLPFWSARRGSGDLQGIFLLEHGARNQRIRLRPAEAVRHLRDQIVWPLGDPEATAACFDLVAELVERVPVWRLPFLPTRDIWPWIEGAS